MNHDFSFAPPPARPLDVAIASNLFDFKSEAEHEIEVLPLSRIVVGRAVDGPRLYVEAEPKYFPLMGGWLAGGTTPPSYPGLRLRGSTSA